MANIFKKIGNWLSDTVVGNLVQTFVVPFGFIKTGIDMYDSAKEAARAQEEAERQSKISSALNGDISNLPYIKGARNTTATGKTQPYVIGRHLFTPYIMNGGGGSYKGWHKIGGECGSEQYYGVVLEGGFSRQVLECLNIGDVKVADFSGDTEPQEGVRRFKADSVFASPESFIEISQDGKGFENTELNRKVVEAEANAQLKNADDDGYEDLIYTLDKNAMSCDITIMFNGLYAVDGKGNKTEKKRTVVPAWSGDYLDLIAQGKSADNATWHEFTFEQTGKKTTYSNDFTYNKQSQLRFNAHAGFSFSDCFSESEDADGNTVYTRKSPIAVRISTPDKKDDKARGDCYVQYVQSTCYSEPGSKASGSLVPEKVVADREARLSTLIGVYIKATEANKDKLDKISVVTNGTAPYLDESGEWAKDASGALLKRPTSNTAAWTLEILTSDTHTPSKMETGEINLDAFKEWHKHCEENGLLVNKVLTSGAQKESLLASLAQAGRAVLYQDTDGRISVAWDRIQSQPKMLLNAENMMSFSWKKDLSRQPDGVKMTFIESGDDVYDTDALVRMYEHFSPDGADQWADSENRSYSAEIKEIEGYGITGHKQAYAYMDYVMRCARLRLKDVSCQIGKEGAFLRPYDRVSVQHWAIGRGDGSTRVKSVIVNAAGGIIGVETYDPVMMGAGEFFYAQIQCTDGEGVRVAAVKAHAEKTREKEIIFTRTFTGKIRAGDIVSYGESESAVTEDFIVRSVQPSGKGYALSLTEYDERIFETGEIPDYESPLSLNGDIRRVNLPESVPEYTADELSAAVHSAASPYVHIVYCDDPETGANYSTTETRAYVGTYSDTEPEAAATFEETDGKPGMKWVKFLDNEAAAREAANVVTHGLHFTSVHKIRDMALSLEEILARIDSDAQEAAAGISVSENEILLKVADMEQGLYSVIQMTKDNILAAVADTDKKLSGMIGIQAGAVSALVEGGGASGQMSMSLELPVMIDKSTFAKMAAASSEAEASAVYAPLEGTDFYAVKGDAGAEAVKALWEKAVKANLIASQVRIDADQVNIAGMTVFTSDKVSSVASEAKSEAVSAAANDAAARQNAIAEKLGYAQSRDASAWDNLVKAAEAGNTVIKGGHINTTLISAKSIDVDGSGFFQKVHSYDTPDNNFWDLSTGEFRIGNDISLEDPVTGLPKKVGNGATYIHFKPESSRFTLALTKFVLSSIASIIKGVFKVNADSEDGIGDDFLTVNPDNTEFSGVPAETVLVKGDIAVHGKSSGDTSAKNHLLSRLTDEDFDTIFSIS